ncbi:MAG: M14 family metallocarboxypeptidase [Methylacidiphilales bacterium]|nr:M14 family metallocarboxypeptidase [Candidatus Methylacidiphilales bacterium]
MNESFAQDFDPAGYARDIEEAARAGGWTVRYLSPCASGPRPWLQRAAKSGPPAPSLYLSAGIHGDEISGPFALLEMLRRPDFFADFNTTIFPLLNPDGLLRGRRENASGIDLNRDYRELKSAEITSHVEALKMLGRFDAAMMLHEDYEGIGAYLFELNEDLPEILGKKIITAMRQHVPIDERPEIDTFPARGGVISRKEILASRGPIEQRTDWAEAVYLTVHLTRVSYTTETPKPLPLEHRVKAQIAAVETLMAALRKEAGVN